MRFPYFGRTSIQMNSIEGNGQRLQVIDQTRYRGSVSQVQAPREIMTQSGPRGVLVSWALPTDSASIAGWKIYKGNEMTLYDTVKDKGTRQSFIETSAGSSPPNTNIFVSAVDSFGNESQKVQVQGAATVEAGSPTMPDAPPDFSNGSGKNTSSVVGTDRTNFGTGNLT